MHKKTKKTPRAIFGLWGIVNIQAQNYDTLMEKINNITADFVLYYFVLIVPMIINASEAIITTISK
jgi:hypothetical protein